MKHLLQFDVWAWVKPFFLREAPDLKVERRYPNFDLLRLFLALEVVATHIYSTMEMPGNIWVPVAPVACFVCLSGFLIPTSLKHSNGTGHFWRKRFLRTVPALIPMLVFVWLALGVPSVRDTIISYFTFGYVGDHNVGPLWSLGVEDLLYVSMVGLVWVGAYKRAWGLWALFGGALCSIVVYMAFLQDIDRYRFWATSTPFFGGSVLWFYRDRLNRIPVWLPGALIPLCFAGTHIWAPLNIVCMPLGCLSAVVLAMNTPPIFKKMPDLSYGLYIWHFPLFFWLAPIVGRDLPHLLGVAAFAVAIACASWLCVESPALKLKNARLRWPFRANRTGQPVVETA